MANFSNFKPGLTIIVSICVSLFFSYATYQFLGGYNNFEVEKQRLQIAHDQIGQAREQRQRVDQYKRAMVTLSQFTRQVKQFELAPEKWQTYDVSVNRSLSFDEAGNILDQLSHGKTYYFQPGALYIGSGVYRNKPVKTASSLQVDLNELQPDGIIPVGGLETDPVLPQSVNTAELQPPIFSEGNRQEGDLTLEVQGKFIVRDGS